MCGMIFLSIVVPIYNNELYLAQCLDSILKLNIDDMEIICVNDGSTDQSAQILDEYIVMDNRIKVIDKRNTGYGDSMNVGIAYAEGEYIGIVESDDFINVAGYEELISVVKKKKPDVAKGNYFNFNSFSRTSDLYENLRGFQYGEVLDENDKEYLFFVAPSIWSAVYKRSFLIEHNIAFLKTPGARFQDTSFAFKVWACAERIVFVKSPIIYYRQDNNMSSSNVTSGAFNICAETLEMERFVKDKNVSEMKPILIKVKYISYLWNVHRLYLSDKLRFLMKIRKEFEDASYSGLLLKKYWNTYEWNEIHQIIFSFEEYIKGIMGIEKNKKTELNYLVDIEPIYIYGAGKVGSELRKTLIKNNVKVKSYIVTDMTDTRTVKDGCPVMSVDEVSDEGIIILGVSERFRQEVIMELNRRFHFNYIELNIK